MTENAPREKSTDLHKMNHTLISVPSKKMKTSKARDADQNVPKGCGAREKTTAFVQALAEHSECVEAPQPRSKLILTQARAAETHFV